VDSITITIDTLTSTDLGINAAATDLSTQTHSVTAISLIDNAIDSVNKMRGDVGAFVNRLQHAINNLNVSNTNQQAAESQIRDVDFAAETSQFTRDQILTQSATAMLAQANSLPQSVLSLLK
jgi:flagellin